MTPLKTKYPGFVTLAVGVVMFVALHLLVEVTEPGTVEVGVVNGARSADWSAFLRPFGVLTWAVAWIIPPIFILHDRQKRAGQLQRSIDEVLAEDRQGHDG